MLLRTAYSHVRVKNIRRGKRIHSISLKQTRCFPMSRKGSTAYHRFMSQDLLKRMHGVERKAREYWLLQLTVCLQHTCAIIGNSEWMCVCACWHASVFVCLCVCVDIPAPLKCRQRFAVEWWEVRVSIKTGHELAAVLKVQPFHGCNKTHSHRG